MPKGPYSQSYGFSSRHVWMWELGHKEGWVLKNWCFWTVVLEKTLESPLKCKAIQPVSPKWNQPWIFFRTDAEAPLLWPLDAKSQLFGKDPDVGKGWKQKEKGVAENEMVGWHHWLQWTWIWASSGRYWRTGKPVMLQSTASQRVRHDLVTEQQQHTVGEHFCCSSLPSPSPGPSVVQLCLLPGHGCQPRDIWTHRVKEQRFVPRSLLFSWDSTRHSGAVSHCWLWTSLWKNYATPSLHQYQSWPCDLLWPIRC